MPPKEPMESKFWTTVKNIKELLYIVVFVGGLLVGYVTLQGDVKSLQKDVQELTEQMKKTNDILMDQKELNGKIIQYMQTK